MNQIDDGGPAFPVTEVTEYGSGPRTEYHAGMTLLDYAAIHAEAPWAVVAEKLYVALGHKNPTFDQVAEGMATLRYKMADAMLAERNRRAEADKIGGDKYKIGGDE